MEHFIPLKKFFPAGLNYKQIHVMLFFIAPFVAFVGLFFVVNTNAQVVFVQRVDVGAATNFTDSASNLWSADRAYTGGSWGYTGSTTITYSTTSAIAGTSDDTLYQTTRRSSSTFSYQFALPNGTYRVRLLFAEIYSPSFRVGARVGDYMIENVLVLDNFDVFAQAGAGNTVVDRSFTATVSDGQLNINIVPVVGSPAINAIEVESATAPAADTQAPSAITNLTATSPTANSVTLSWTAPGDDSTVGTATSYDIRYSTALINDTNWDLATQVTGEPVPQAAGTTNQSMVAGGLSPSITYYFAMKTSDEVPNISPLSNVVNATTTAAPVYTQRVDTGSSSNFTDSVGNVWSSDRAFTTGSFGYVGGNTYTGDQSAIANTNDDPLYRNTRFASSFEYRFSVPNGMYQVTLKLAEIRTASCAIGARAFNISAEGSTVISNHDSFAQAGCATVADRTFTTSVTDGILNINFTPISGYASVNGIEVIATQPDFTFTGTPSSQLTGLTNTVTYTAEVKFTGGFSSDNIDVWVTGVPAGISAVYEPDPMPHQGKSVLTLTANNPAPGTYTLTMGATARGITHQQNVTLVVTDQPDFGLSVFPSNQNVSTGSSVGYDVTITPMNSFSGPVNFSVSGLPSGATASFSPNPATPPATARMTVNTALSTPEGTYTLIITGVSGSLTHTTQTNLIVASGQAWSIASVGSTGVDNNSLVVSKARNDGQNRIYVGTIQTGRVMEFSWNGTSWGSGVDVGGSPSSREIHNMGQGPGRNDGVNRIYAGSLDGNVYELSWGGTNWSQATVGTSNSFGALHAVIGDGRNDGINRVYVGRGTSVYEYTWNATISSWDSVLIGDVAGGRAHGLALGRGRNGTTNALYIASSAAGTYEAVFSGGSWTMAPMGDSGDIVYVTVGAGRNDGIMRVYSADRAGNRAREFTWSGSAWTFINLPAVSETQVEPYVLDGRGDGRQRLYVSGGSGNAYEYTWNSSGWTTNLLGGGAGYLYGFHYGAGRNDNKTRLYGTSFNGSVYEYTF